MQQSLSDRGLSPEMKVALSAYYYFDPTEPDKEVERVEHSYPPSEHTTSSESTLSAAGLSALQQETASDSVSNVSSWLADSSDPTTAPEAPLVDRELAGQDDGP